jgi:acetyltransferase-like isoleucine patch superfamily enzyme
MAGFLKSLASVIAWLTALPAAAAYLLAAALIGPERAFPGWSQAISLLPGYSGEYLRRAFYRLVLPQCGAGSVISFGTIFSHPTVAIGANVYVGPFGCLGDVTLEDDVLVGSQVSITNGCRQHGIGRLDVPVREQPGEWPRVTIGRDSWIGDRAVVMADVGKHCVVGAGAVVAKPVPDYAIVVGNPARIVRHRNQVPEASCDDWTMTRAGRVSAALPSQDPPSSDDRLSQPSLLAAGPEPKDEYR